MDEETATFLRWLVALAAVLIVVLAGKLDADLLYGVAVGAILPTTAAIKGVVGEAS